MYRHLFHKRKVIKLQSDIAKAAGLFSNEYEYYRSQKAQMNQWKISPPTVSEGGYTNSIRKALSAMYSALF